MATIKVDQKTGVVSIECDDAFLMKYLAGVTRSISFAPVDIGKKAGVVRAPKANRAKRKKRAAAKSVKTPKAAVKAVGRGMTAAVLDVVNKAKNGISVPDIVKKSGAASNQKVYNILSKAKKDGKIASTVKGIYKPV
jgi:hypothetical protein